MLTAAPSLRPCQRDQVQRVVGITAPPLSHATPRGYYGFRSNHQYCPAWRGTQSGGDVTGDLLASLINRE
jgi:hypothetical protein